MTAEPLIVALGRKRNLDQETAYTLCRLIEPVGSDIMENWDWEWLSKKRSDYRILLDVSLLERAWPLLRQKDWFSLQTNGSREKRVTTIVPLREFTRLRTLILQDNALQDLAPLASLTKLQKLSLHGNRIEYIGVLSL